MSWMRSFQIMNKAPKHDEMLRVVEKSSVDGGVRTRLEASHIVDKFLVENNIGTTATLLALIKQHRMFGSSQDQKKFTYILEALAIDIGTADDGRGIEPLERDAIFLEQKDRIPDTDMFGGEPLE